MEEVIETIPVTDAKGDELIVYEYQKFVPHLTALGLLRGGGQKRLMLDTGEAVARVDRDTFVIAATGENSCGFAEAKAVWILRARCLHSAHSRPWPLTLSFGDSEKGRLGKSQPPFVVHRN